MKNQELSNHMFNIATRLTRLNAEVGAEIPYWAQDDIAQVAIKCQELSDRLQVEANKTNAALVECARDVAKGRMDSLDALVKHSPDMTIAQFKELVG